MVTRRLKQALRERLSESARRRLRGIREGLTVGAVFALVLSHLPGRQVARLKERLHALGTLDFPDRPIHMTLDSSMQVARMTACHKEPETVAWIRERLRPGDVFYDIGANVGAYSFVADVVAGGRARIYAFEPSFSTFAALSENVFLNGCSGRIVPLQLALGRQTGICDFHYRDVRPGAAEHAMSGTVGATVSEFTPLYSQPVLSFRLDDLIRDFGLHPPNHIKLDVDGGELDVLVGAEETLRAPALRSLLVEVDEAIHGGRVHDFVEELGFKFVSRHQRLRSESANHIFDR